MDAPRRRNEDYASWGQPVLAPADGVVAAALDTIADNLPGTVDTAVGSGGNYVMIDHGNGEFSYLAHLRKGSVVVHVGDRVVAGQRLAACGNSGNTNGPHLHYNLQTRGAPETGTGLPVQFVDYVVDGKPVERGEPVTGQIVRNASPVRLPPHRR